MTPGRIRSVAAHLGVMGLGAAAYASTRRWGGRRPARAAAALPVLVGLGWGVIAVGERRRPFSEDWQHSDGDLAEDVKFLASIGLPTVLGRLLGRRLSRRLPTVVDGDRLGAVPAVVLAVVAYDLHHTLYHRLFHEWGPGWRVHSVHHSPRRLYLMNATRFHPIEILVDVTGETVISRLIRLNGPQEAAYMVIRGVYGQLQHANIDVDSGPLNRLFSTPDLHRWHHSEIYEEGDNNYGAVTSVWDQLFGSYFDPDRPFGSRLGVGRMPEFPTRWGELHRAPFEWREIRAANAATWV